MRNGIPQVLLREQNVNLVVDAVYFVVRVLRNRLRGFNEPSVSSEPGAQSQELAKEALAQIESVERTTISKMSKSVLENYIRDLEKHVLALTVSDHATSEQSARSILGDIRATQR